MDQKRFLLGTYDVRAYFFDVTFGLRVRYVSQCTLIKPIKMYELHLSSIRLNADPKSMLRPRSLYDAKYGTLSPPSMDRLYTLGAAASIEDVESEQS